MTPPLSEAGLHGEARELEALLDEYAQAQELDPRRARMLADAILVRARESGFAAESGLSHFDDVPAALARLDAWICDLKEMRIGDGLHVFGKINAEAYAGALASHSALKNCARGEIDGLLAALDGRFVPPGPAGAPSRGRLDVLPTGRNLYSIDPRAVPTRTSWEIGRQAARAFIQRYMQDHGDYPRRIVLDLWGSATMRTGGDDLAQAFALLGVRPLWDHASARVSGFEIEPAAMLERPRVDVTLRISGLFRDVFPMQIALFDAAVRAVAALDEDSETNPLAHSQASGEVPLRIFGAAPGAYGIDLQLPRMPGPRAPNSAGIISRRAAPPIPLTMRRSKPAPPLPSASKVPTHLCMCRMLPKPTFSPATPLPSMRAAFSPRRRRSAMHLRSIMPMRRGRTAQSYAVSTRISPASCAVARQIRAGLPGRCGTAIGARRKSPRRSPTCWHLPQRRMRYIRTSSISSMMRRSATTK
jgi:hypothetical protein